jgi:hypothetical protein
LAHTIQVISDRPLTRVLESKEAIGQADHTTGSGDRLV